MATIKCPWCCGSIANDCNGDGDVRCDCDSPTREISKIREQQARRIKEMESWNATLSTLINQINVNSANLAPIDRAEIRNQIEIALNTFWTFETRGPIVGEVNQVPRVKRKYTRRAK